MIATPVAYSIREDATANNFSATPLSVSNAIQAHQPSVQSHHAQVFIAQAIPYGVGESPDTAHCLRAGASKADKHESTTYIAQAIPIHDQATRFAGKRGDKQDGKGNGLGIGEPGAPMNTLTKGDRHAVAQPIAFSTEQTPKFNSDQALTLTKQSPTGGGQPQAVMSNMAVRRLTPVECERLQGFPDGYTNIPWRGKPEAPDGPRYKALGNSWAVPNVRWIGARIDNYLKTTKGEVK
jgi:DNA (cytosine-5)-methyltransferase 1